MSKTATKPRVEVDVRRATPADNDAMCQVFADITMNSDLGLSVHREPDFDALYRMQVTEWDAWVGERDDGTLGGMATIFVRDGYINGEVRKVGYLGDLRIAPDVRGGGILRSLFGPELREHSMRHGCDEYLTGIIASNTLAIRALTGENAKAMGIPPYHLARKFDIRGLHFTTPLLRRSKAFEVDRASSEDIPTIAEFLDADAKTRPYGYVLNEQELRRRLGEWPGLKIEDFYIARDDVGNIVGCIAIWDACGVKRTFVTHYRGSMKRVKLGYNAFATLGRFAKLPEPGNPLQYLYVTHQAIPSENPQILRCLLESVYRDKRRSGNVFLSCCVFDGDPLEPAFRGFLKTNLAAHLYVVTMPGKKPHLESFATQRPAFEMALV